MPPGAAGLRRARGPRPCDPGRPCRAVGGVQKGNRRVAPFGSPRRAPSGARVRVRDTAPKGGDAASRLRERSGAQRAVARPRRGDVQKVSGSTQDPQPSSSSNCQRQRFLGYNLDGESLTTSRRHPDDHR